MILRFDKMCRWIFIASLLLLIPSVKWLTFVDELLSYLLLGIAIVDIVAKGHFRRHRQLLITVAIMALYAVYSLVFLNYNTAPYILMDFIIQLKPFLAFWVLMSLRSEFTRKERQSVKGLCCLNAACCALMLIHPIIAETVVQHVAVCGNIIFISVVVYITCVVSPDGKIAWKHMLTIVAMLLAGLLCTRAKYYGVAVLTFFMLLFYRPGMLRGFQFKHIAMILVTILLVLAVSWQKLSYYFFTGNSDTFDPQVTQSYARPVLYATAGLIMIDHFPLGTGLASFASYASSINYSQVYYEYGINTVHGLSPNFPHFICDAYYPLLAQFGILGVILFSFFWRWIYKKLRHFVKGSNAINYKYHFVAGSIIICWVLIESIGSTTFAQSTGMVMMMALGLLCGKALELKSDEMPQQQKRKLKILYQI